MLAVLQGVVCYISKNQKKRIENRKEAKRVQKRKIVSKKKVKERVISSGEIKRPSLSFVHR